MFGCSSPALFLRSPLLPSICAPFDHFVCHISAIYLSFPAFPLFRPHLRFPGLLVMHFDVSWLKVSCLYSFIVYKWLISDGTGRLWCYRPTDRPFTRIHVLQLASSSVLLCRTGKLRFLALISSILLWRWNEEGSHNLESCAKSDDLARSCIVLTFATAMALFQWNCGL